MEPGVSRRAVEPGLVSEAAAGGSASMGRRGLRDSSRDQTTFRWEIPRRRSSFRMTRARGQPWVLDRSETSKAVGSSLFPEPIALMILTCKAVHLVTNSSLAATVSMQSTT